MNNISLYKTLYYISLGLFILAFGGFMRNLFIPPNEEAILMSVWPIIPLVLGWVIFFINQNRGIKN